MACVASRPPTLASPRCCLKTTAPGSLRLTNLFESSVLSSKKRREASDPPSASIRLRRRWLCTAGVPNVRAAPAMHVAMAGGGPNASHVLPFSAEVFRRQP